MNSGSLATRSGHAGLPQDGLRIVINDHSLGTDDNASHYYAYKQPSDVLLRCNGVGAKFRGNKIQIVVLLLGQVTTNAVFNPLRLTTIGFAP